MRSILDPKIDLNFTVHYLIKYAKKLEINKLSGYIDFFFYVKIFKVITMHVLVVIQVTY